MSAAEYYIAKDVTYKLPEGRFRAKITRVDKRLVKGARDGRKNVIIHFEVFIKGKERFECCARATFPDDDSRNSALRFFLEDLLGKEFFIEHTDEKIDLDKILRGLDCEIELVHGNGCRRCIDARFILHLIYTLQFPDFIDDSLALNPVRRSATQSHSPIIDRGRQVVVNDCVCQQHPEHLIPDDAVCSPTFRKSRRFLARSINICDRSGWPVGIRSAANDKSCQQHNTK